MWAGFAMVLIAAGLAGVPRDLLEAARVDGANEWQVFRRVTVPLLAPVLLGRPRHADDQRAEGLRPRLHHRAAARCRTTPTCSRSSCTGLVRQRQQPGPRQRASACFCCCWSCPVDVFNVRRLGRRSAMTHAAGTDERHRLVQPALPRRPRIAARAGGGVRAGLPAPGRPVLAGADVRAAAVARCATRRHTPAAAGGRCSPRPAQLTVDNYRHAAGEQRRSPARFSTPC